VRYHRLVAGFVAALFVFGPALLWVSGVRPVAFENRPLSAAPDPSQGWDALDEVGPWATDHLPGRKNAVRTKAWIDYFVLGTVPTASSAGPGSTIAGPDGPMRKAPTVIRGSDGELFLGEDFDRACASGPGFRQHLERLAKVAHLIERSKRSAVFTVGVNKSSVATDALPWVLPHGACAQHAIARQNRILDGTKDPLFVNVRSELAAEQAAGNPTYWNTDTHWSSVGSALLAHGVADKLGVGLDNRIELRRTERTKTGDLTTLAGLTFEETAPATVVDTGARVRETAESDAYDPKTPVYGVHRWTAAPGKGLVQGRSLLVGDSFTYFALDNLRPLFTRGEFLWLAHPATPEQIIDGIVRSDTVVLELVQRNMVSSELAQPAFYNQLRKALREADADR